MTVADSSTMPAQRSGGTVLVTGSSRGIGRAIALAAAAEGWDVVVHGRSRQSEAESTAAQIRSMGRQARVLMFDVANRAEARQALEADMQDHGAYYGVVLNAGLTRDNAFPALSDDDWDQVLRTNLDGFYNVLHPVMMPMIRRRAPGRIVCVASVSGLVGNRGQVNYSASGRADRGREGAGHRAGPSSDHRQLRGARPDRDRDDR